MIRLPLSPGLLVTAIASIDSIVTLSNTSFTVFGTALAWAFIARVGLTPPSFAEDCVARASATICLFSGLKKERSKEVLIVCTYVY